MLTKGTFETKAEAEGVAKSGDIILARNQRLFHDSAWGVTSEVEWGKMFNSFLNTWVFWEKIK